MNVMGADDVKVSVAVNDVNVGEHFQVMVDLSCGVEAAGLHKLDGSFGLFQKRHKYSHPVLTADAAQDCGGDAVPYQVKQLVGVDLVFDPVGLPAA